MTGVQMTTIRQRSAQEMFTRAPCVRDGKCVSTQRSSSGSSSSAAPTVPSSAMSWQYYKRGEVRAAC